MKWDVEYTHESIQDLLRLDNSQRIQVLKAINRVSGNPLPSSEGGYGKPLGNRMSGHLGGYFKIKLQKMGLRVVYCLVREDKLMRIIIISVRDDETVYRLAQKRIQ